MKHIRLDVKYPSRVFTVPPNLTDEQKIKFAEKSTPEQVSWDIISGGVLLTFPSDKNKFMSREELRMWSKVQEKMTDENGKPLTGEVELSDEQFEFVVKVVGAEGFLPNGATAVTAFRDYLDQVKVEQKDL